MRILLSIAMERAGRGELAELHVDQGSLAKEVRRGKAEQRWHKDVFVQAAAKPAFA